MSHSFLRTAASILTLSCLTHGTACSSDSDESADSSKSTGGGESGDGDGTGGREALGGASNTLGGAGGGESMGPPNAPDCADRPVIQSGRNYGDVMEPYDYSVFAVRLSSEVPEGTYSIRVHDDSAGEAYLYLDGTLVDSFEYDPEASLADATTQTVVFPATSSSTSIPKRWRT